MSALHRIPFLQERTCGIKCKNITLCKNSSNARCHSIPTFLIWVRLGGGFKYAGVHREKVTRPEATQAWGVRPKIVMGTRRQRGDYKRLTWDFVSLLPWRNVHPVRQDISCQGAVCVSLHCCTLCIGSSSFDFILVTARTGKITFMGKGRNPLGSCNYSGVDTSG